MSEFVRPRPRLVSAKHGFVLIASQFNPKYVQGLVNHCTDELRRLSPASNVTLHLVPGAFEIPIVARRYHKVGDELLAVQPKGGPAGGPYTYGGDAVTWEEVPGGFSWGKASADYTYATGSDSYVDVHPCGDRDGANADTNTTVRVYLPSTAGRCPNVRQNDVVGYAYDRGGVAVSTTDVLDDVIGSVKAWSGSVASLLLTAWIFDSTKENCAA